MSNFTWRDLQLAVLSMDAYNRGYGTQINGLDGRGPRVGSATVGRLEPSL